MRGVYYSACSLCYKTIAQFHQKCLLMRDCLLFRRLLLPESTVCTLKSTINNYHLTGKKCNLFDCKNHNLQQEKSWLKALKINAENNNFH